MVFSFAKAGYPDVLRCILPQLAGAARFESAEKSSLLLRFARGFGSDARNDGESFFFRCLILQSFYDMLNQRIADGCFDKLKAVIT